MCQHRDVSMGDAPVECFRVYEENENRLLVSYYYNCPVTPENVKVERNISVNPELYTRDVSSEFHAFQTLEDVKNWWCSRTITMEEAGVVIHRCILEGDVKSGVWSEGYHIKTYTGNFLTRLEEVKLS